MDSDSNPTRKIKLSTKVLPLFLIFLAFPPLLSAVTSEPKPSAYEMLSNYNFPIGILPKGVVDYDLESSTGRFSAFLNGSCSFSLEGSYQLRYQSTVKGYISEGKLSRIQGVSVKLFFFWVEIVEVSRNGNDLDFSVGIAGAGFPIENFLECPQCGCGLNCDDDEKKLGKIRSNLLVSSS